MNEYDIVRRFEEEVAAWAGSKYAVAVSSCTNALFLACYYKFRWEEEIFGKCRHFVHIPKRTYPGVPCSIIHAGGEVYFTEETWMGCYQLRPYPIYDSAKRFRPNMYIKDSLYCLSFHVKKHLPIGRGGMILTDDLKAVEWLKRARFDGRREKPLSDDYFDVLGWNVYMTPEQAARGLQLFHCIRDTEDQEEIPDYPDLSRYPIYQQRKDK